MQGRRTAQSSVSPGVPSPGTMDGSYASSTPPTPGTVGSLSSTAGSVASRTKRLGRKLSFWKKGETSAADVRSSTRALQKSHQKYSAATQHALDTLRNWSTQLGAPPKFPREWQSRLASPELQDLLVCVCQAMYPVCANEALLTQIYADLTSGFRSLSYYEENCKRVAGEVAAAERRYYKERRRCTRMIEAAAGGTEEAETVAASELAIYENVCLGLKSQMADAGAQYRRQCHTELPRQFAPVLAYHRQKEEALRQAITAIQDARMDYPQAECDNGRASTVPSGLYTPPTASALTAPLRHAEHLRSMRGAATSASSRMEGIYTPTVPSSSDPWATR